MTTNISFYKETNFQEHPVIGKIPKDWKVVKLENVVEIWDKYRVPVKEQDRKPGPFPYCGANGVIDYVAGYTHDGEFVLLAEDGGFFGPFENSAYIMRGKFWANNHIHILKAIEGILINEFLMYCLNFMDLTPFLTGSTRPKLTQEDMRKIPLPLPPIQEQQKIAEILSTVDEAIQKTDEIIVKTERLRKGLMQELLTKGLFLGFMFDTNIFNAILDRHIDLKQLPRNLKYYVTHIQYDEICNTQNEERRRRLLEIVEKVPSEFIVTEGATYDVSKYGMAKYMSEADAKQYNEMLKRLKELDEKSGKKKPPENQARDILIALTCMKNCLTLVTNDKNLKEVAQEFQCSVITFEQLLEGEYREFKDTQIGKIPAHWRVIEVGDILSLEYGRGLPERERMPGIYPVVGSNGIVGYHNQAIVKGPGIVIGRKGTIGAVSWIDQDFWPIDTTYYVKTKLSNIFLKWLFYELIYLNPARFHLADVVPGLKRELVYSLKMPLPPFPEQQKIAEIISIIDKKLELERNEKAKLEKVKQGLMDLLLTGKIRVKV